MKHQTTQFKPIILTAMKYDLSFLAILIVILLIRDRMEFIGNGGIVFAIFSILLTFGLSFAFVYNDNNPSKMGQIFLPFQLFILLIAFIGSFVLSFKEPMALYMLIIFKSIISVTISYFINTKSTNAIK